MPLIEYWPTPEKKFPYLMPMALSQMALASLKHNCCANICVIHRVDLSEDVHTNVRQFDFERRMTILNSSQQ